MVKFYGLVSAILLMPRGAQEICCYTPARTAPKKSNLVFLVPRMQSGETINAPWLAQRIGRCDPGISHLGLRGMRGVSPGV